jgi:hypothetical protein
LFDSDVKANARSGNRIEAAIPSGRGDRVRLTIRTADGKELIAADAMIK